MNGTHTHPKDALAADQRAVLRELAQRQVLLAFDFDGTLAPIVSDPAEARMSPTTRELMWQLTQRYPVIVVTGRAQPDALRRVRGVGVLEVVGNHGIEPRHAANRFADCVRAWRPQLEACVASEPGVVLEDKIFSVAVHYRHAQDPVRAQAAILAVAEKLEGARIIGGKAVVNIMPEGAADKGRALLREQERLYCDCAIYVGDDETDEDVFVHAAPERLLGIRVGARTESAATHYIAEQAAIDELIRVLIELRPAPLSAAATEP